jgi:hypothetical protein
VTGKHAGESEAAEPLSKVAGVPLALLSQRQVRQPRVLARHGPGRLAVAGQVNDWKPVDHDSLLEWPFPAGLFRPVDAVLVSVVTADYLTVEQGLADVSCRCPETGHSVDGVDRKAKAVCLIAYSEFQRRVDIALLLIAAAVQVVLARPAVG